VALDYLHQGDFTVIDLIPRHPGFLAYGAGATLEIECSGGLCTAGEPHIVTIPVPDWLKGSGPGEECDGTTCTGNEICVSSRVCIDGAFICECSSNRGKSSLAWAPAYAGATEESAQPRRRRQNSIALTYRRLERRSRRIWWAM
jgi:hypothetical protein